MDDGAPQERLNLLPAAQEHILAQDNGKERYLNAVKELSQAFALAVPHEEALRIRDDVGFFQAVRAALSKRAAGEARPEEELDLAVRQIISRAVASEGVMDIFAAAGLDRPDISVLSEEFLAEVRGMPQRNLAAELLQKLLKGEISTRRRKNIVQARSFAEMLEQTLRRYQNRGIEAAQVIEELIQLARDMREANARGERLGLSEDELAFYDALETNDSAVHVLGDETLRAIAQELAGTVRSNVTIDWTLRENVRAHLRVLVRRILRKHGYPPDKQEKATMTVLEQAEVCRRDGPPPDVPRSRGALQRQLPALIPLRPRSITILTRPQMRFPCLSLPFGKERLLVTRSSHSVTSFLAVRFGGSVWIAQPEHDHLEGPFEDRDREELSHPPAGPTLGLGQPSASRSRDPRRPATMTAQSEPRRVRVPTSGVGRESAVHYQVVQQAISHSPDHQRLFRIDSQLVLNAIYRVPDGHGRAAPRLGDLGV